MFNNQSSFINNHFHRRHGLRIDRDKRRLASESPTNTSRSVSHFSGRLSQYAMLPKWQTVTERQAISASQIGRRRVRTQSRKLPLWSLLEIVDLHVTQWSTTVLEAYEFGIPSIIIHPIGLEIFFQEYKKGYVKTAFSKKLKQKIWNAFFAPLCYAVSGSLLSEREDAFQKVH